MNTKKLWIIVGIVVLLIILYLVFGSSSAKASTPKASTIPLNTNPNGTNSVANIINSVGSLIPGVSSLFGKNTTPNPNATVANQYCDANGNPITPPCDADGLDNNGFLCCA